jgi:hypothetical protein
VATTAISIPTAAIMFPRRAEVGERSPRMPRMKQIAATR